ncbi:WD40-repeat-containing domain protein [Aspergillus coremiiformis]|uniref:WD40-repeat-containing domain protein n=1 Tax=Aspergillus coremiiformis TaxID=138285 RepID=A0A5N6YW66_9EURO|nr:WD40-repeat-containing domain protein [Aspergillus coremiiformis]
MFFNLNSSTSVALSTHFFPLSQVKGQIYKVFDLADHPFTYIPSSAAPDRPDPLIPIEPASYPRSATATDSILSSSVDNPYRTPGVPGNFYLSSAHRRRRRSTPDLVENTAEGTGGLAGDSTASEVGIPEQRIHTTEGHSPSPKRRRLTNMRPDGVSSANGPSYVSNGSIASPSHKVGLSHSLNGQASYASNGDLHTNGLQKSFVHASPYFGHDREEVTRILIQSLYELGYNGAASLLSKESGYQLESPAVATFRGAVLAGRWVEAERIMVQSFYPDGTRRAANNDGDHLPTKERLVLVENAEMNEMLFYLRQQKFLELLETRNLSAALTVLRHELTPLNYDIGRLHALSSLLMCPPEHLHDQAGWDGSISSSRERLLSELSKSISPSVMIPDNRLAILLDHVKQNQINQCLYHNTASPPSLYSDHMCDRADFPLRPGIELSQHSDEVWYCQFSHDGTKLATAGRDHSVIIYDTNTFTVLHKLMEHDEGVAHACWSPDDSKLITCSQDNKARVWNVDTGRCLLTINHHQHPVTAAAWAADGESFVTASLDNASQLCHWNMRGHALHMWQGGFRVVDCAITPDGRRLIAADVEEKIHVYNFTTHEEEYCLALKSKPTSVAVSRDSRQMLVNLAEGQIQLIDIDTTDVIRSFEGQKQGSFVIRSTFGGAAENFVVSGSEDSRVYVWHKENGTLVETLEGHISGCVNAISWNPTNPRLFASAGDDCLVRIWTRERDANPHTTTSNHRTTSASGFARTSAIRSTSSF